ncbi:MAG: ATP-binding cassette domain-containing protein [SAR324 cluster bacterium]|uniref:ATP-binding cassette domain-containing protein n=1 Tax=SAR324 cluster bacterium TaxID=2024889 RepID=A0A7X9IKS4_9DELT|nr:ATP-binding cassette domain-containing protein [SAR324 cluster bacterium]
MTIELYHIEKSFGEVLVVSDFSLSIQNGELFVLLGSSGSGKSTILRLIAGLLLPDQGSIELHGRNVTNLPPQQRNTGFVFQNYAIFRHMSVLENVAFGLRVRGVPRANRKKRSQELLDLVGLAGFEKRYPSELSGGQRQRVALARALAYEPEVLLLDEPFGALDARIRSQLRRSLKDIQRELGVTSILVTHDQEEAFELADRIGIIDRGRLIEVGNAENLYHRPKTEYAATFIGGGNVLVGRNEKGGLRLGHNLLPFPEGAPPHEDGAPVRVLFRPENLRIQTNDFEKSQHLISLGQGILTEKTFAGAYRRLRFSLETLEGARPISPALRYGQRYASVEAILPNNTSNIEQEWQVGQKLWLGVPSFHILDPSGLKLLICVDNADIKNKALKTASQIESASHGPVTVLMSCPEHSPQDRAHQKLERACAEAQLSKTARVEMKIRQGILKKEILSEVQEHFYDLVVLAIESFKNDRTFAALVGRLLLSNHVPVLIAKEIPRDLKQVLICIAADQSDTAIVRFSARVARHTRSQVSVLHVLNDKSEEDEARVLRHVEQARMTLEAHGVNAESLIKNGLIIDTILSEAIESQYGLLIVGAPRPKGESDLVIQLIRAAKGPVMVIPSEE